MNGFTFVHSTVEHNGVVLNHPLRIIQHKAYLPLTNTLKRQMALFPEPSLNVSVTVVVPILNRLPGEWLASSCTLAPELSVAVGLIQVTAVELAPSGASAMIVDGHPEITGGMVSIFPESGTPVE